MTMDDAATRSRAPRPSPASRGVEEHRELIKVFRRFDADNSGTMDAGELIQALKFMGVVVSPELCGEILASVDADHSGDLNFDEFVVLHEQAAVRSVFMEIDTDGSGTIATSELAAAMRKLGYKLGPEEVAEMLKSVDKDRSGAVDFAEFMEFFRSVPDASLDAISAKWFSLAGLDIGSDIAAPLPPSTVSPLTFLVAGGAAGVVSRCLTAPFERLKLSAQINPEANQGMVATARGIVAKEGAAGLWAGNGANCIRVFPFAGIVALTYSQLIKRLPCDTVMDPMEPVYRAAAGATAGLVGTTVVYPLDLARARLTVQAELPAGAPRYAGVVDCLKSVVHKEGAAGLYRGMGPTLAAVAPFLAFQQSVYDVLKFTALSYDVPAGLPLFLACGAAAGAAAQSLVHPMDLVRRQMQMGEEGAAAARGPIGTMTKLAATRGVRALFSGLTPTVIKTMPSVAITKAVGDALLANAASKD